MKDPEVAEKLVPVDHPFTSKRPLIDTNYFDTYNRDNVTLVDIRHAPIEEITPTGHPHRRTASTSSTSSCSPPASTP